MTKQAWKDTTTKTIFNCWKHVQICIYDNSEDEMDETVNNDDETERS